jgi:hypothetical protein
VLPRTAEIANEGVGAGHRDRPAGSDRTISEHRGAVDAFGQSSAAAARIRDSGVRPVASLPSSKHHVHQWVPATRRLPRHPRAGLQRIAIDQTGQDGQPADAVGEHVMERHHQRAPATRQPGDKGDRPKRPALCSRSTSLVAAAFSRAWSPGAAHSMDEMGPATSNDESSPRIGRPHQNGTAISRCRISGTDATRLASATLVSARPSSPSSTVFSASWRLPYGDPRPRFSRCPATDSTSNECRCSQTDPASPAIPSQPVQPFWRRSTFSRLRS